MERTIRRVSRTLNRAKRHQLVALVRAYNKEKQRWLEELSRPRNLRYIKQQRKLRDQYVSQKYVSPNGLSARMWKLALDEAAAMLDRSWRSVSFDLRRTVRANENLDKTQQHYCAWVLKNYEALGDLVQGKTPLPEHIKGESDLFERAARYLHRIVRRKHIRAPRVKKSCSVTLDSSCYRLFEKNGAQFVSVVSLTPRKRIAVPLLGHTVLRGNIRVVLDGDRVQVHHTASLSERSIKTSEVRAVDIGYTEVAHDMDGNSYGAGFGEKMTAYSDYLMSKNRRRAKLRALRDKAIERGDYAKARRIQNYNLGTAKKDARIAREKATIERVMNEAINKLLSEMPDVVVTEDLSHAFSFNKGRNWNRRLNMWCRGRLPS